MTINIFVLKGDLNGKIVVVRFFFCWVYIMRDWKKKLLCENAKNIIICRQKFHRVFVRETCFKRFLEFHETVSSNRTLLYFLKLVSYFSRQLANHSSAISEGQFTCSFYTIKKGVFLVSPIYISSLDPNFVLFAVHASAMIIRHNGTAISSSSACSVSTMLKKYAQF